MAKKKDKKAEPDLEISVVEHPDGTKRTIQERGVLRRKTRPGPGDSVEFNQRAKLERLRESIRDDLEAKGIPSDRIPSYVSVDSGPFLSSTEVDTEAVLQDRSRSISIRTWSDLAKDRVEPLTTDEALVEFLEAIGSILSGFNDNQLWEIQRYAGAYAVLNIHACGTNRLAQRRHLVIKAAAKARTAKTNNTISKLIVEHHAHALWRKNPTRVGNANGTASEIMPLVAADIGLNAAEMDMDQKRKLKEAIRQQLRRLKAN